MDTIALYAFATHGQPCYPVFAQKSGGSTEFHLSPSSPDARPMALFTMRIRTPKPLSVHHTAYDIELMHNKHETAVECAKHHLEWRSL
jgi:hypothetical protein